MASPEQVLARRPFGQTRLSVPPVSIGCAPLGNMPETFAYGVTEEDARAAIHAALDSPLNYIDTAALYGDGESERRVGLVLRELGGLPEGAILQTKQGRDPQTNDFSGETIKRRFERSLELLGVDKIQIVYLHDAEWTTFEDSLAPGGPIEVLQGYKEQGLIDHLGVASGPIDLEIRYVELGIFDAVITHNRYTLLNASADPLLTVASRARCCRTECRAIRQRHAGKRTGCLPTLRLPAGIGGDDRSSPPDGGHLRAARRAAGGGRVTVLPA